jgi:ankyrin repeat protein
MIDAGWTPLHCAAHGCHLTVCRLLLQHNADASLVTHNNSTPLHYLVRKDICGTGHGAKSTHHAGNDANNNAGRDTTIGGKKMVERILGKIRTLVVDDVADQVIDVMIQQVLNNTNPTRIFAEISFVLR